MKKFVIIDGNNICFRSYYALPLLANFEGVVSNAVFGFANTLIKIIETENPDYIAVAFDKGKKTFRHQLYKDYKAKRRPTPPDLIAQIPLLKEMLKTMNIKYLEFDDIEADDIIGVLSRRFETENIVVSADKDVLQLINRNTIVYAPQKGSDSVVYNEEKLQEVFGISPKQIIDLKAIMGDSSDNIPGVSGIGEKGALTLLQNYTDLDGVYANIENIKGKTQEKLLNDKESAYFSKELATIITEHNFKASLEDFTYSYPFGQETLEFFKRYQFNSLLRKEEIFLNSTTKEIVQDVDINVVNVESIKYFSFKSVKELNEISMYLDDNVFSCWDGDTEYNFNLKPDLINPTFTLEEVIDIFKDVIESKDVAKNFFDAKDFMHRVSSCDVKVGRVDFDCVVAKYLINANMKVGDLESNIDAMRVNSNTFAYAVYAIKEKLVEKLKELELSELYNQVELPLVPILYSMEEAGVKVDSEELDRLDKKYLSELETLTNEIYQMAGTNFNINSPKQLAEVLFGKLGLKAKSKKESTNQNVLHELIGQHPIVSKILEYRQYYKLHSTYIRAYIDFKDENDKVHTIFNQTQTATGRLSSVEPNLQNIPARSNEGKSLRKIFIPSTPDGTLISADYSQIELRLLAHFCEDERLINTFNNDEDIHALTASEIFGIPMQMVSDDMRRSAKAINFGIIYGISDWGLSQNIGITKLEAGNYIKLYFEKYPKIEKYMRENVEFAKENGYIRTLLKRIRYIPELKGPKIKQLFGERVAMNMPLQGTAADIIKLAMVKVYNTFKKENLKSKLILQIHDELVVDAVLGEEEKVIGILKSCMENVVDLKVKLLVNVAAGQNLSEAK
ncbi:MAG: DNA polymerase I [Clostridia bacterium]|nr:DNA polymerase I [Clostridia bacterium]